MNKSAAGAASRKGKGRADWYKQTSAASIGIEMAVAICGGSLLGMWIERRFTHWSPWTTLIGFTIGLGAATLAILRVIRENEAEAAQRRAAGLNLDGTPIEGATPSPELPATPMARPETSEDPEAAELAAIRRRQKAAGLPSRGPLP